MFVPQGRPILRAQVEDELELQCLSKEGTLDPGTIARVVSESMHSKGMLFSSVKPMELVNGTKVIKYG